MYHTLYTVCIHVTVCVPSYIYIITNLAMVTHPLAVANTFFFMLNLPNPSPLVPVATGENSKHTPAITARPLQQLNTHWVYQSQGHILAPDRKPKAIALTEHDFSHHRTLFLRDRRYCLYYHSTTQIKPAVGIQHLLIPRNIQWDPRPPCINCFHLHEYVSVFQYCKPHSYLKSTGYLSQS